MEIKLYCLDLSETREAKKYLWLILEYYLQNARLQMINIQISLNIIDIFCLHIFLLILLYCPIDFIVFGGYWLIYFPWLFISQVLSVRIWAIVREGCITKTMQLLYVHYYLVRRRASGPLQCVAFTFKIVLYLVSVAHYIYIYIYICVCVCKCVCVCEVLCIK